MRPVRLLALCAGFAAAAALAPTTTARPADEFATVKGQVILPDFVAEPEDLSKSDAPTKAHCESKGKLIKNVVVVDKKTKGLKNVVVYLRPDNVNRKAVFPQDKIAPALAKAKPKNHVVDQPCCQFEPRIVAARDGDTLEVKNSAPISHNFNYGGDPKNDTFNINMAPGQDKKLGNPVGAGNAVIYKCDIHPWMAGRLFVFDHPYFVLTDAEGKFEMKDVPVGDWRVVYRHENGFHKGKDGFLGEKVTVKAGANEVPVVKFEFPKPQP